MGKTVFIISGEESGDLHGASLIHAMKRIDPSLSVHGMGGTRMKEAGLVGPDSKEVSVVGVVEVLEKLPTLWRTFKEIKNGLAAERPDALVLIDFPDFNLRVAKEAKRLGIPVVYYISPQVWAWRKGRVGKIAELVDKMLVVFPFEVAIYKAAGVDVEYVGHPLSDAVVCQLTKQEARAALGVDTQGPVISILPGSRTGEVRRLLATMLTAAEQIQKRLVEKPVFLLPAAGSIDDRVLAGFLKETFADVRVVRGAMYTALRASDAAIVASGTATLETALIGTPMAIVYKMASLSYGIARLLVDVEFVGLPNIVAGRKVVPELIQDKATPESISSEIIDFIIDAGRTERVMQGYAEIKERLGAGGAADKAARAIFELIEKKSGPVKEPATDIHP